MDYQTNTETIKRFTRANMWLTWAYSQTRSFEHAMGLVMLITSHSPKLRHIVLDTLQIDASAKQLANYWRN